MNKAEYFGKVVTELMEVSEDSVLGRSREQEVVDARWMVIYFAYLCCNKHFKLCVSYLDITEDYSQTHLKLRLK